MFRAILLFLRASVSSVHRHSLFVTPPPPPPEWAGLGKLFAFAWVGCETEVPARMRFFLTRYGVFFPSPFLFVSCSHLC